MLGQRRQTTGKTLGHATELPRALAAVKLAEDQCGFLHAHGRNRRFNTAAHRHIELRERVESGLVLINGRGQCDFIDSRVYGVQIEAEHAATGRRFRQLYRAIVDALLAEETHVVVTANLARLIEQEGRHVQISPRHRAVADGDTEGAGGHRSVGAGSQSTHGRTALAASLLRSCAVRPLATVPTAVKSQPAAVRLR